MSNRVLLFVAVLSWPCMVATAQETQSDWLVTGYVKDLVSLNASGDSSLADNLLHHRLNISWYPKEQFTMRLELRNRLFTGSTVQALPDYGALIDVNNDYFDLSVMHTSERLVWHSMIDRFYLDWHAHDWEIRLGRQRINWGLNLVWNPNDLFNAYSFFDFDYEERQGSDALLIRRYTGMASSLALAATLADSFDETVVAGMWRWNSNKYDYQLIAGKARTDLTLGFGWAGNIKDAGFKGEITGFLPYANHGDESAALVASISVDYSFDNALYLNGSFLYSSGASTNPSPQETFMLEAQQPIGAKDLSPFRYSLFLQSSYPITPLFQASLATIYYPGPRHGLFISPALTYSLVQNIDIDLLGQFYFDAQPAPYQAQAILLFLRLKWSY